MSDAQTPKVIYILGDGRSGSTLLSMMLSHAVGATNVGELQLAAERAWVKPEYCSCGSLATDCPFWTGIGHALQDQGISDFRDVDRLQRLFDRNGSLPKVLIKRKYESADFARYGEINRTLFAALAAPTGAVAIVDASKCLARASSLRRALGDRLFIVHLVRDPRGVAWSVGKSLSKNLEAGVNRDRTGKPPFKAAIRWLIINFLSGRTKRFAKERFIRIRYEDFTADPDGVVARIVAMAGTPTPPGRDAPVHTIAGNKLRMAGKVELKADTSWLTQMPSRSRRLVWAITAPLARFYGYRAQPAAESKV